MDYKTYTPEIREYLIIAIKPNNSSLDMKRSGFGASYFALHRGVRISRT